jgi:hypothetical protein
LNTTFSSSALLMGARRRIALALIALALLWLSVFWAAFGGRAPPSVTSASKPVAAALQVVVASGEAVPGTGVLDHFDIGGQAVPAPSNRRGDVVFFATLLRSTAEEGLFLAADKGVAKLAAVGDAVPSGERIAGFGERPGASLNSGGTVAFMAALTGGKSTSGIFLAQNGKIIPVALSGGVAPGVVGGTLADFEAPILNDAGDVAFLASIRRGRETQEAIYVHRHNELKKVIGSGDLVPGGGAFTSFGNPVINNNGDVAFAALIEQGPILAGIFVGAGRDPRLLLAAGAPAPAGGVFTRFSERLDFNDAGTVALNSGIRQGATAGAITVIENDVTRVVASVGDAAPGGGTFSAFAAWPVLSQTGTIAFIAAVDGGPNSMGLFLSESEGLRRIAAVGEALPDGSRLTALPLYPTLAISQQGAVTFAATTARDGAPNQVLLYYGSLRPKK